MLAPVLFGAGAGGLLAARRPARRLLASPAAVEWVRLALEPLLRAGREGYSPSTPERRRLAGARRGRGDRGRLVRRRRGRRRCRWRSPAPASPPGRSRAAAPATAPRSSAPCRTSPTAIADSLTAGRSLRASLPAAATSLDGPPAVELARLGAELDLGAPTADAIAAWRGRMRSARVDAFAAALLSQRLAGGDLAGLLRRFAAGAAERDRVAEDARAATAQARFTGLLVVAMPSGGALFAELLQPGFLLGVLRAPASAVLLALAAALQLAGFVAIRRLSRVVE